MAIRTAPPQSLKCLAGLLPVAQIEILFCLRNWRADVTLLGNGVNNLLQTHNIHFTVFCHRYCFGAKISIICNFCEAILDLELLREDADGGVLVLRVVKPTRSLHPT